MEFRLTDEQQTAVDASVSENLVSAAAGSGKTKVLSERIVSRIKSGDTSIDRLLIVTFTRAAAAQMRERIYDAIEKEYKKSGKEHLKRQLSLVGGADICTIDSFCIDLVRRNFFRVCVPPDFTIAENSEMTILRDEVMGEILDEMYDKGDSNFLSIAKTVGKGKNDNALKEMILKLYFATVAFADPEGWLDDAVLRHVEGSAENDELFKIIEDEIKDRLDDLKDALQIGYHEALGYGIDSYAHIFSGEVKNLNDNAAGSVVERIEAFRFLSFAGLKVDKSLEEEKKLLQGIHEDAKKIFAKTLELFEIYKTGRGISFERVSGLVELVKLFRKRYMEEKLSRKELEFSDCEYFALKVLESENGNEALDELRDKYDEIYIDEYQDTNPLQDALFSMVSRKDRGEPNMFIVGDVKQSIYRFRHSDPKLFADKAERLEDAKDGRKMILSRNFRSRREVLDSVNCVFENVMRKNTGGIDYNEEHALKCGAQYIEYSKNKSEIFVLQKKYEDDEENAELAREQRETLVVAEKIKKMMDEGFLVSDKGEMRRIRYSDIAVLSRVITGKADMIKNVFDLMDIPSYCDAGRGFFETVEVKTLISLLQVIDNPLCDIPLAAVLRSPMFSFSENELMEIRLDGRDKPFYENLTAASEKEGELSEKCREFKTKLEGWRAFSKVISVEKLIWKVLEESGYYSFVGALPGGRARQDNLSLLGDMAASYETGRHKGLYSFIGHIVKSEAIGTAVERSGESMGDAVLVTTIHKSKGLEFPVVFVIGCGAEFNDDDATDSMIFSPECGIGLVHMLPEKRIKFRPAEYSAVSLMILRESHAEQMRLLYVAMTRAKEKLILVGSVDNIKRKLNWWQGYKNGRRMSDYKVRSLKNYFDYVCPYAKDEYWDLTVVEALPQIEEKHEEKKGEEKPFVRDERALEKLCYRYPYENVRIIPSKMSVSEIKKMSMESEEGAVLYPQDAKRRVPAFMEKETSLSGAAKGTAYHRAMELVSLDEKNVKERLSEFVEKGLMTKKEAECIDAEKIEAFLSSPLAERLRNAKRVWREEPFTISIDAKDVFEEGGDEKICVQGTIDCFFEDAYGKLVLLDYKTDIYDEPSEVMEKYKKQLELYELAIFMGFSQKCDEKCLYLFHKNDIISL